MLLIVSSQILVWGAVEIARIFGVSDMIIGLTIVAVGTSLPELTSSVIAPRRGEHDIALGNGAHQSFRGWGISGRLCGIYDLPYRQGCGGQVAVFSLDHRFYQ